jgi:hypothetical protein
MENQVFNFIVHTLELMNISPIQISEDADLLFDLNLDVPHMDSLFSSIEDQFHLNNSLMFTPEVASLRGLAHYVGAWAMAA